MSVANDSGDPPTRRRLSALLSADVEGYSRLMADDEAATIRTLTAYRAIFTEHIERHDGRVVDAPGDNLLAEFSSAIDAVDCSIKIQQHLAEQNKALTQSRQMRFRIGINIGDIIVESDRIYGDGVNIAARVESIAPAGGVAISSMVYEQIEGKLEFNYTDLGPQTFKNINRPIRVYQVAGSSAEVSLASVTNPPPTELPDKPSIAVLPFANRSQDQEQEYFSDGMTEDLITDLSKISSLFVISRNSVFSYKGTSVNPRQVAEELGVQFVLEGSVRKSGNRVRITAQLVDAATGYHLWAERYDRELTDIFALQDEVIQQITAALAIQLTAGERQRIATPPTQDLAAYDAFVRGREEYARRTVEANGIARQLFEQALRLDPRYAEAHAFLGRTYLTELINQWNVSPDRLERVFECGLRAVELDNSQPTAHETLAYAHLARHEHDEAISEARRAIDFDPNFADAYITLAEILTFAGEAQSALPAIEQAMRLNPHYSPNYLWAQGHAELLLNRFQAAIATFGRVITRNPDHFVSYVMLVVAHVELDDLQSARSAANEMLRISPNYSVSVGERRSPYRDAESSRRQYAALRAAGLGS